MPFEPPPLPKDRQMPNLFPATIDETTPFIDEDGNLAPDVREMLERCARLAAADPDVVKAMNDGDTEAVNAAIVREITAEFDRRLHIARIIISDPEARERAVEIGFRMFPKDVVQDAV